MYMDDGDLTSVIREATSVSRATEGLPCEHWEIISIRQVPRSITGDDIFDDDF